MPGSPDLILPRHKVAIFVHGCFWYRHANCKVASTPKSNTEYWQKKFDTNVARDANAIGRLDALGWRTYIVWECELTSQSKAEASGKLLASVIRQDRSERISKNEA